MKNILVFILLTFIGFVFQSCEKNALETEVAIDQIILKNGKGEILEEYQYDLVAGKFLGEGPLEKAIVIKGILVSKEPNNSGGHNYRCIKDSEAICYEK